MKLRRLLWPFGALGLLVTLSMITPLVPWGARQLAGPWNDPQGDVLIVLAGSLQSHETGHAPVIGHNSYLRAVYALRTWRAGGFRKIILTGDADTTLGMQAFLSAGGVPGDALLTDPDSRSTHDHPVHCRPLLAANPGRAVLLTSDYHMFRAHAVFRKAGIEVQPRPIPDVIKNSSASLIWRWQGFMVLAGESVKIAYYRYQGWI